MSGGVFVGGGGLRVAVGGIWVAVCGKGVRVGSGDGVKVKVGVGVSEGTVVAITITVSLIMTGVAVSGSRVFVGSLGDVASATSAVADGTTFATVVGGGEPIPKFEPNKINNVAHNKTPIAAAAAMAR